MNEDESPNPRYGHTAVLYKKEIFIYGGVTPKEYFKPREDLLIFNLSKNYIIYFLDNFKFYSEKTKSLTEIQWRRNHIAHAIGGVMITHGGLLENGRVTNDTLILEFSNLKWNRLEIKGIRPPHLAYHCSDFVLEYDKPNNQSYHIYKGINHHEVRNNHRIKHEGIYIFGGIDEEKNYRNDIHILKVGRKPCEWLQPKIDGIPPYPRTMAKINFYQELSILIIYGGKNDLLKKSIFNDIYVLDIENFNWIRAVSYPFIPKERAEHGSILYNNQILILGGINLKKYHAMDFFIINVDLFNNKLRDREKYKEYENKSKSIEKNKKGEYRYNENSKVSNLK